MRSPLRILFTATVALAVFALTALAQTMTLSGTVLGEDGKPLEGAQIKIIRTDMKGTYPVKTNKKGEYLYAGLPFNGVFNVVLEVKGKEVDQIQGVRSRGGAPVEGVNFDLRKIAAGQSAAQAQAQAQQAAAQRNMSDAEKAALEKTRREQEAAIAKNQELNAAFNAGKEAAASKNWNVAIEAFEKASTLDPAQHVVWGNLADSYLARKQPGDIEKGVAAYAKAVELKGDDAAYHNNYALALAQVKKFDEAQAELTKAAQLDPASAGKYYYNLGAVYVNTGQSKPAGDAFRKAIDADPNYADAYYQLGLVLFGDATTSADGKIVPPPGTAENFNKYLQLRPDGANADAAKAMLQAMGTTVETTISTKKQPAPKKK
jgi:tetratricopeptide (TPR) repeat protein